MYGKRRQSGYTLIEILIVGLVSTVLGVGLWTLGRSTYDSQYEILGQNTANTNARQSVDELADKLRGAQALTAATASSITFTDNGGSSLHYWLSGGNLVKSTNGSPSTGTVVALNVNSLSFSYWTYKYGLWSYSTAPGVPGDVCAVDLSVTGTMNGTTRQISASVRIRQK